MLGEKSQEGIPVLLLVITGMFQELIQLRQVGDREVEALEEQQAGEQYGGDPHHVF